MNMAVLIDVPGIQKHIKEKHESFLEDVGNFSFKVSQDHQLSLTRLVAKITRVMECFVEEHVIDKFAPYNIPYADGEYVRAFCLTRKEFAESVYIWTDGKMIVMGDSRFPITDTDCEVVRDVDIDNFDGLEFSKLLLDYIHRKIYSRQESYEQRIFGLKGVDK